jgi:nitric oxide reductase large subunit
MNDLLERTLLDGRVCCGLAIAMWILKGLGIAGFLPGWPIVLFFILGICNFWANR